MSQEACTVTCVLDLDTARHVVFALKARSRALGYWHPFGGDKKCLLAAEVLQEAIDEACKEIAWQNTPKVEAGLPLAERGSGV
jgi:hypothetical protein